MTSPGVRPTRHWRGWLDVASSLAMLVAAGFIIYGFVVSPRGASPAPVSLPEEPIAVSWAASIGAPDASVGMVVFSDFECPFCRRFALETLPSIRKAYVDSGRVMLLFAHLPLVDVHPNAMPAAVAAECARRGNAFWPMHDLMFAATPVLDSSRFVDYALGLGLDTTDFETCVSGGPSVAIEQSMKVVNQLGITGTPTILLGPLEGGELSATAVLQGAQPLAAFSKAIDELLSRLDS